MRPDVLSKPGPRISACTYGLSRVPFRGPRKPLEGRYVACLGGSETFGKYLERPWPELLETRLGDTCLNLGCLNAGVDVFLRDAAVKALAHDASATVIQVMGAANMSNRFYRVHPRRNDRFLGPTDALRSLYPEVDFAEIAFTRHLLQVLLRVSEERFDELRVELQRVWLRRMTQLVAEIGGPVLLLWLAEHAPASSGPVEDAEELRRDPVLVTADMLQALRPQVSAIVESRPSAAALAQGVTGMVFGALDLHAAREMLNAAAHDEATNLLEPALRAALD